MIEIKNVNNSFVYDVKNGKRVIPKSKLKMLAEDNTISFNGDKVNVEEINAVGTPKEIVDSINNDTIKRYDMLLSVTRYGSASISGTCEDGSVYKRTFYSTDGVNKITYDDSFCSDVYIIDADKQSVDIEILNKEQYIEVPCSSQTSTNSVIRLNGCYTRFYGKQWYQQTVDVNNCKLKKTYIYTHANINCYSAFTKTHFVDNVFDGTNLIMEDGSDVLFAGETLDNLFWYSFKVKKIIMPKIGVSGSITFNNMCNHCENLEEIVFTEIVGDTPKLTSMQFGFTANKLKQFKFPKVLIESNTDMTYGFYLSSLLEEIDATDLVYNSFPTSTKYNGMLSGCDSLKTIKLGDITQEIYDWWYAILTSHKLENQVEITYTKLIKNPSFKLIGPTEFVYTYAESEFNQMRWVDQSYFIYATEMGCDMMVVSPIYKDCTVDTMYWGFNYDGIFCDSSLNIFCCDCKNLYIGKNIYKNGREVYFNDSNKIENIYYSGTDSEIIDYLYNNFPDKNVTILDYCEYDNNSNGQYFGFLVTTE